MMEDGKYEFDLKNFSVREAGRQIRRSVMAVLRFILVTLSITLCVYLFFALIVNTDTERRLRRENRAYAAASEGLREKAGLLEDAVASLQYKDNRIYRDIFNTDAPAVDPASSLEFLFGSDTIPDAKIVAYTDSKAGTLVDEAADIERNFERIFRRLASGDGTLPPMSIPVADISYPQIGAGCGVKVNPFLKASVRHNGLDIIALQGSLVVAVADGVVKEVQRSGKGMGNMVVVSHDGGYLTRYAHLAETLVEPGQKVKRGRRIGTVGMSGSTYAPHLHYEVWRDSVALDPVNHLFASVSPEDYANMLYMASNTEQSMD